MQIFATFEHSLYIELAIAALESKGVKNIFAVPLDNRTEDRKLFDTLHRSDGISLSSKGFALAVFISVITTSKGFVWEWGPIYWGIIGAGGGFLLGVIIDLFINKVIRKKQRLIRGKFSEVILIVECKKEETDMVEKILWGNFAFGVAKVD